MSSDRPIVKLSEIVDFKTGRLDSNQAEEGGIYPFFTCSPTTLQINSYAFDTEAVLLAGNNANGVFSVKYYKGKFNAYQRTYVITPLDSLRVSVRWLYFRIKHVTTELQHLSVGTSTKFLTKKILDAFEVALPSFGEQEAIADVLWSLQNKLDNNQQINQTLEQIAQAIFKSWFVDFEPVKAKIQANQNGQDPERAAMRAISGKTDEELDVQGRTNAAGAGSAGAADALGSDWYKQLKEIAALFPDELEDSELGEIPKGWNVTKLGQILEFNPKRTIKKGELAPYLDMKNVPTQGHLAEDVYLREMGSGTKFINGDTLLARITPCLENGKTAFVDFLEDYQVGWGSTEYIVIRPKENRPLSLSYVIARQESFRTKAIQTMTGTSGRQRANAKALAELNWLDYPHDLLKAFDQVSGSYLRKAKNNGEENKSLSEIRDALLPKLLSGEISLSESQFTAGAVA